MTSRLADAKTFLKKMLLGKEPVRIDEIQAAVFYTPISWRTIRRAKDALKVRAIYGEDHKWYWSLPSLPEDPRKDSRRRAAAAARRRKTEPVDPDDIKSPIVTGIREEVEPGKPRTLLELLGRQPMPNDDDDSGGTTH